MIKKLSIIILVLLLSSVLMISCNNKDKTASTTKGLAYYAGEWTAVFSDPSDSYKFVIGNDGSLTMTDYNNVRAQNIIDKGNGTFTMTVYSGSDFNITIKFYDDVSGTIDDDISGDGTIKKQ
ncbi:hypothetical protein [Brachyspira murdochii]|uniref:Lipoprotein n=1 Tax=Brachyspira murdochii TaxID=84378 RepID=A0ABX5BAD2_9SPIR|nr:hypothetical protein [Brachyspira murdochii]PPS23132.1 hypothetical protein DJ52_00685 [Brachyspira murdochii]